MIQGRGTNETEVGMALHRETVPTASIFLFPHLQNPSHARTPREEYPETWGKVRMARL